MIEETEVKVETLDELLARGQQIVRKQQEEAAWKAKQAQDARNAKNLAEWAEVDAAIKSLLPEAVHEYLVADMYDKQENVRDLDYRSFHLEIPGYAPIWFVYNPAGIQAAGGLVIEAAEIPFDFWGELDDDDGYLMGWPTRRDRMSKFDRFETALVFAREQGERYLKREKELTDMSATLKAKAAQRKAEEEARAAIPPAPTLADQVIAAYDHLSACRQSLEEAATYLLTCKIARDTREADAWKNGLVEGTNDTQRRNWLRGYLVTENELVELAEKAKREAELAFDLARYETERVKLMVAMQEGGE